jgi:ribosomal protein S18 acetylase RimI-like enzyme
VLIRDAADMNDVRTLFREYAQAQGHAVCFQQLETELSGLPGAYAAPRGRLLMAVDDATMAGCVAIRPLTQVTCEMKRLYVRPAFRSTGLGRQLTMEALAEARAIGYGRLVLDTLPTMTEAIALYRSLGFHQIARYNDNHFEGTIFLERRLV